MSTRVYIESMPGGETLRAAKYRVDDSGDRALVDKYPPGCSLGLDLEPGHVIELIAEPTLPDGPLYRPEGQSHD